MIWPSSFFFVCAAVLAAATATVGFRTWRARHPTPSTITELGTDPDRSVATAEALPGTDTSEIVEVGDDDPAHLEATQPPATSAKRVVVHLYGPVWVSGVELPTRATVQLELVSLIACHPRGLSEDQLRNLHDPNKEPRNFRRQLSQANDRVISETGEPLYLLDGDRCRPAEGVATAASLIEGATLDLAQQPDDEHRRQAALVIADLLEDVTGPAFASSGWRWAEDDLARHCTSVAAKAAADAATILLTDDPAAALDVIRAGLRAAPDDPALVDLESVAADTVAAANQSAAWPATGPQLTG